MPDFKTYVRENLPPFGVPGAQEAEIVEELALEFQERYERAIRNGCSPEEAWDEVTKNARPWRELAQDLRSELRPSRQPEPGQHHSNTFIGWVDGIRHDLRYAARQLMKSPTFTLIAVLTLALGIGANTAIFSLLNAVLLRDLPVQDPQTLVFFGNALPEGNTGFLANGKLFSYPFYREFQRRNDVFTNVAAIHSIMFSTHGRIAGNTEPDGVGVELVSGTYFNTLGISPAIGRILTGSDDRTPGGHPVAVASYAWWQRRFSGNPSIVGTTMRIGPIVYTIVGVTPPGFFGVTVGQSPDLWIPLAMQKEMSPGWHGLEDNLFQSLHLIARPKPGIGGEKAQTNTNVIARQILLEHAGSKTSQEELDAIQRVQIQLTSAATGRSRLRPQFSSPLRILMAVVGLVLVIACANIANLLLARATVRQREIAIRMSLGAVRSRLIRQLLIESGLLALGGAAGGVLFAWSTSGLLLVLASKGSHVLPIRVAPDAAVLLFTMAVTVATVLLFGTAPAFYATRINPAPSLKEGRGVMASPRRNRLARGLVVAQVALSLVLVVCAGLFLRTLVNLRGVETGFDKQNVLLIGIDPGAAGYKPDARLESMMERVEDRVRSIPGVRGASFAFFVFNNGGFITSINVPGRLESEKDPIVDHNIVGVQYLDVMKMPLILGRTFDSRDSMASRKVAVINETMARTYFESSPLGRMFRIADEPGWQDIEVVGVVRDAKYLELEEKSMPAAFYPHSQHQERLLYNFVVRYASDAKSTFPEIREAVHDVEPALDITDFTTLAQVVDDSVLNKRLLAQLSSFFGLLAAFLACLGIYAVMSYGVTRRTGEFGIRMALGAARRNVLWIVLRETLWLASIGAGLGLVLVAASSRLFESLLFGVLSYDAITFSLAVVGMIAVALLAGYLPARRATRIDPIVALRHE